METEIILDPPGSIFISVTNQTVLDPSSLCDFTTFNFPPYNDFKRL